MATGRLGLPGALACAAAGIIASAGRASAAEGLTRESAQEAARRELSRSEYATAEPPLYARVLGRAIRALGRLLDGVSGATPGGWVGLFLLLVLLVLAAVAVRVRLGPLTRGGAVFDGRAAGRSLTAGDHRREADRLAETGEWARAVRERLRAVVRELESRGILEVRPGRTADEVAADGGAVLPALADDLRLAARIFDEVWYGGRTATADSYATMVSVDDKVRPGRAVLSGTGAGQ